MLRSIIKGRCLSIAELVATLEMASSQGCRTCRTPSFFHRASLSTFLHLPNSLLDHHNHQNIVAFVGELAHGFIEYFSSNGQLPFQIIAGKLPRWRSTCPSRCPQSVSPRQQGPCPTGAGMCRARLSRVQRRSTRVCSSYVHLRCSSQ